MALALQHGFRRFARLASPLAARLFHDEFSSPEALPQKRKPLESPQLPASGSIANKYQVFRDADATVILDVEEERQLQLLREQEAAEGRTETPDRSDALPSIFNGINLQRGKTGVFDIEDLVTVLRLNNAENVFVCTVPADIKYVDYICVATGMSFRHMRGIAEFVRKVYKMKRNPSSDLIPKIEGENCRDWMALDLGNIALHIFSERAREQYDLESLWAVGSKYDRECNKPEEPLVELFERHSVYLSDLKPAKKDFSNSTSSGT